MGRMSKIEDERKVFYRGPLASFVGNGIFLIR
jgi:hypothetical protein